MENQRTYTQLDSVFIFIYFNIVLSVYFLGMAPFTFFPVYTWVYIYISSKHCWHRVKINLYIYRYIQVVLSWTGLNSCKKQASYGNKKDYISCCDFKFHVIGRSSDNWFYNSVSCIYKKNCAGYLDIEVTRNNSMAVIVAGEIYKIKFVFMSTLGNQLGSFVQQVWFIRV